jgi:hypothetical protein
VKGLFQEPRAKKKKGTIGIEEEPAQTQAHSWTTSLAGFLFKQGLVNSPPTKLAI